VFSTLSLLTSTNLAANWEAKEEMMPIAVTIRGKKIASGV